MEAQRQILPIGTVHVTDDEGYLVGASAVEKIHKPWSAIVDEIVGEYVERLGGDLHSIYIRGSVSRATAIEGISDIDEFVVLNRPVKDTDLAWTQKFHARLKESYPFCKGIDLMYATATDILSGEKRVMAFFIKVNSACVYGQDLDPRLPKFKPGRQALIAALQLEHKTSLDFLTDESGGLTVAQRCKWVSKQILRAGAELVMEREGAYSRDLYPCYEMFSRHYPGAEPQMKRMLELALWPTDDQNELVEAVGAIRPLLLTELEKLYPGAVSPIL